MQNWQWKLNKAKRSLHLFEFKFFCLQFVVKVFIRSIQSRELILYGRRVHQLMIHTVNKLLASLIEGIDVIFTILKHRQ